MWGLWGLFSHKEMFNLTLMTLLRVEGHLKIGNFALKLPAASQTLLQIILGLADYIVWIQEISDPLDQVQHIFSLKKWLIFYRRLKTFLFWWNGSFALKLILVVRKWIIISSVLIDSYKISLMRLGSFFLYFFTLAAEETKKNSILKIINTRKRFCHNHALLFIS